ncbi:beta-ketoacyl-ACP synthase [Chitinimonas koreensis]|nr:beta-ketoacyl-ACP synthase [Chitinimonas koreensis]
MTQAIYLNRLGLVCALGAGVDEVRAALFAEAPSGVAPLAGLLPGRTLHLGAVTAPLADLAGLPLAHRSRNNALLLTALAQIRPAVDAAIARHGAARVGVVLGTSTSGIGESERAVAALQRDGALDADFHIGQQEMGSPALMLAEYLGLSGPAIVLSTACSSSAKALASAARLLRAGLCDAVIAGGADSLCAFTVAGFSALESVSAERCNPMSANRHGINIGEGAALFLLGTEPGPVRLAGWGESSDAHHISAPAPDGRGALAAMRAALEQAGVAPAAIDYLNLHGTATPQNDAMESLAVRELFGEALPASSTKPLTGHTLGAAGALEAALCWLALTDNPQGRLPPHWWDGAADPALPALNLVQPGQALGRPLDYALSNSFAFGGSNAALVLERVRDEAAGRADEAAGAVPEDGTTTAPRSTVVSRAATARRAAADYPIAELVPHAGAMSLLDRAIEGDGEHFVAEVDIRPGGLFCGDDGVGAWVGIEYMAQAVAAWAGWQARQRGEAPKVGFLLGSRRYACSVPVFRSGQVLRVAVRQEFRADNGLGQFDCRIEIAGETVATAALTVFEPDDALQFLGGEG